MFRLQGGCVRDILCFIRAALLFHLHVLAQESICSHKKCGSDVMSLWSTVEGILG